ncbi:unnamed protein product [Litomosoides sigmodontis]|uniref:GST N-terminal domain-containing protein n=1 Tax=Litomosoides sigmodontis TaxID=42156 RepID=A0A3P6SLW0_LITSI|nr:unnamed protein product [Litomosoides sigmodontis]
MTFIAQNSAAASVAENGSETKTDSKNTLENKKEFGIKLRSNHFSETPYGHVPILDVSGKILAESHAIERFLARKFKLMGENEWEAAKIDEIICNLEEVWLKVHPWIHNENSTKQDEAFVNETITPFLQRYEQFLLDSNSSYFVGNKISLAGLAVFNILQYFHELTPRYPKQAEFTVQIGQMPRIRTWINNRPDTKY